MTEYGIYRKGFDEGKLKGYEQGKKDEIIDFEKWFINGNYKSILDIQRYINKRKKKLT